MLRNTVSERHLRHVIPLLVKNNNHSVGWMEHSDTHQLAPMMGIAALHPSYKNHQLMLFLSGNGITGGDSRLREQMQAALSAPGCYATPCQSGYFFALLRLAIIGLID